MASYDQYLSALSPTDLAELQAWNPASFAQRFTNADNAAANALSTARTSGLSDNYVPLYGGGDIVPGTTQRIMTSLGLENPYLPVFRTQGSEGWEGTSFAPTPGTAYRLTDGSGNVLGTANDAAGIKSLTEMANALSKDQGKTANWNLEQQIMTGTDPSKNIAPTWSGVAKDRPDDSMGFLGTMLDVGLPIMGAAIPGLGTLAGMGLGSLASSATQGRSLKDTLLRAGLTVGTAGLMDKLGVNAALNNALGGGADPGSLAGDVLGSSTVMSDVNDLVANNLASAFGSSAGSAAGGALGGDILVNGIRGALPGVLSGAASSALGSGLGPLVGGGGAPQPGDLVVNGQRPATPDIVSGAVGPAVGALPGAVPQPGDIVVNGQRPFEPLPVLPAPPGALPAPSGALGDITVTAQNQPQGQPGDEIVVTAPQGAGALPSATGAIASTVFPELTQSPNAPTQTAPKSTLDKISDYLQAGGIGLTVLGGIGDMLKGNQNDPAALMPGGLNGGLNPIFSQTLPSTPTIPGGVGPAANLTPRPLGGTGQPETDWNTYGMRPEMSFFNYVPKGYASGGGVRAGASHYVSDTPRDGRSDDVKALLSDGEYVVDAETVAMLGNGSNEAGARKLDDLRVNIRKHKGRNLAKGKISPNAKQAHSYMSGGHK